MQNGEKANQLTQRATPGPKARAQLERGQKTISSAYYREHPLVVDYGQGITVVDVDGNRYLDFSSGLLTMPVGHNHPEVIAAIQKQVERSYHTSTHFYCESWLHYSEALAELAPFTDETAVLLCSATTEAKQVAVELATYHTGGRYVIEFIAPHHGNKSRSLAPVMRRAHMAREHLLPVPFPHPQRSPLVHGTGESEDLGLRTVDYIESIIMGSSIDSGDIAAILVEPLQEGSGYAVPPASFLPALREFCNRHRILLIANEEQSGLGRTGAWWAVEQWGVEPDILCIAKGCASGLALGGVLMPKSLDRWPMKMHGKSFQGSTVACAAALATLALLQPDGPANAAQEGFYIKETLNLLAGHHPTIGYVHGMGLLIGVEFVWDRAHNEPATALRNRVNQRCFEHGLLLTSCGESTLRFTPPLTVTRNEIDEALAIFEYALSLAEAELLRC